MKWLAILVLLLGSLAGLAGWRSHAARAHRVTVISAVRPVRADLQTAVTVTGVLYPSHSVDIKYDGQEIVERLNVKEGDHVKAGEVLAVIYPARRAAHLNIVDALRFE